MDNAKLKDPLKICYFGIYSPVSAPRDRVYIDGLKKRSVTFIECVDSAPSWQKFFNLFKKHKEMRGDYDILWVGYLSGITVPLAKIVSRKKIIFNALNSMYESIILDQERYERLSPRAILIWCADFLAFHLSDVVLVETEQQKNFLSDIFWVRRSKMHVIFTGANEATFHPDPAVKKFENFTAIFRGWFVNATGADQVVRAAKILQDRKEGVDFIMIGRGQCQNDIQNFAKELGLSNVRIVMDYLPEDKLRETILRSHIMLGQFGLHPRMDRTIQYKTFEAMALGMPYVTRDSLSNRELLIDRQHCLFVRADDARDLADKILELKADMSLRDKLSAGARNLHENKLTSEILSGKVYGILREIIANHMHT